ncbi:pinin/SDK/memA/ protein conserved region-domain-containing protein [Xylogone sp. PMI_703]|nr:pinin/SDK/memA/ protein conserved region-domain-containing protein [Xylogone sp. PMI_703]
MAESIGPIASAVIIPESDPLSIKRKQSPTPEPTPSKRSRLSNEGSIESATTLRASPSREPEPASEPLPDAPREPSKDGGLDRRKTSIQEERKRGQRLFGGLLSTLSQSAPNGQQKRRQEIERRQLEKAKQQKVEDEGRRAEKLAKLNAVRKVEQVKFEREVMRMRHSNMLAMANCLYTKTEPRLYYKPWELQPEEEDRIKTQIAEAEAIIEREVEEFNLKHPKDDATAEGETNGRSKEPVGEPHKESPSVPIAVDTTNPKPSQEVPSQPSKTEKESVEENNGEVVEEAEEDTVIY